MDSSNASAASSANEATSTFAAPRVTVPVTIRSLLDAGAHYGHQTQRWNPKMLPYIYGARNGVHIINLDITQRKWEMARKFIVDKISLGGNLFMVGTKIQARDIIKEESERCGAFFVASRWLGGTLSNFQTIKRSIDRMRKLEALLADANTEGTKIRLGKKEKLDISRELDKLNANIGGIRLMKRPPEILFVVDVVKEAIAVSEANRLHIPVIALVDTNADPARIAFPIPSNDDASRTIRLFVAAVADAVLEGQAIYRSRFPTGGQMGEQKKIEAPLANADILATEQGAAVV